MKKLSIAVILSIILVCSSLSYGKANDGVVWEKSDYGIFGGNIKELKIDRQNPDTVYVVATGLYKTTDGGENWDCLNQNTNSLKLSDLVVDPNQANVIYAVIDARLQRSGDGGQSWQLRHTGLVGSFRKLAINPVNSEILFATTSSGVFKSADAGLNWQAINQSEQNIYHISINPQDTNILYASGIGGGVYRSTDEGLTWVKSDGLTDKHVTDLIPDPENANLVYAGTSGGVFISNDGGLNWSLASNGIPAVKIISMTIHPLISETVFAITEDEVLYKSIDSGLSWNLMEEEIKPRVIDINPLDPNVYYIGTGIDMYKSMNDGMDWTPVNQGLIAAGAAPVSLDLHNRNNIYVATDIGVFISRDSAITWSKASGLPQGGWCMTAIDKQSPNIIYVIHYGNGVFRSTDYGETWSEANNGLDNLLARYIVTDPVNQNVAYLATNDGIFKTVNAGSSWTLLYAGWLADEYANKLMVDPSNPNIIYALTYMGSLLRTTNAGASWVWINANIPSRGIYSFELYPADTNIIYAATFYGVYTSNVSDDKWVLIEGSPTFLDGIAIDPRNPNIIYTVSLQKRIYRSIDRGLTWTTYDNGISTPVGSDLIIDPQNTELIYASSAFGTTIYKTKVLALENKSFLPMMFK